MSKIARILATLPLFTVLAGCEDPETLELLEAHAAAVEAVENGCDACQDEVDELEALLDGEAPHEDADLADGEPERCPPLPIDDLKNRRPDGDPPPPQLATR